MPERSDDRDGPTDRTIAADLVDYLRDNPGVCADISVHAGRFPWVRHRDGEFQYARYGQQGRAKGRVAGTVLDEDDVVDLFAKNPVNLVPVDEAYLWSPSTKTVWEDAAEQDAFTDSDRCWWCGGSERDHDLEEYETTEDGDCLLCDECHESWDDAGQIEAVVNGGTA